MTNPFAKMKESTSRNEQSRRRLASFRRVVSIVTKFRLGRLGRRSLVVVVAAAVIALAANTFLPYRQYLDQGRSIEQAKQELFELEQRRSDLETRLERAQDKTIIKREARKQMSLVEPGDELFRVVVPADVINLPRGWYLPGIEYLITGKSE
ncbi:MAG TPA: septum formation initiator family protein [Acidimicrobiales bacterium]|nr:septum formation initiator family protein [Acidimicrobiales bacterium]